VYADENRHPRIVVFVVRVGDQIRLDIPLLTLPSWLEEVDQDLVIEVVRLALVLVSSAPLEQFGDLGGGHVACGEQVFSPDDVPRLVLEASFP
jgi:hypothetical protein